MVSEAVHYKGVAPATLAVLAVEVQFAMAASATAVPFPKCQTECDSTVAEAPALFEPNPDDPPSPCIDVCRLDRSYAYCIGCHRTIDEIKRWSAMTAAEKRALLDALPARRAACGG